MIDHFKEQLKEQLELPLPAHRAHKKVMGHRKSLHQLGGVPARARQSAVLILIYPKKEILHTVFILRQTYKGVHSAQIGFPGGKAEDYDTNLEATALREANEELNVDLKKIDLLGSLTPLYVPPSNFLITPFVGVQQTTPDFIADRREVAEILESPLLSFLGEDKLISTTVNVNQSEIETKGYFFNDRIIWGATGMILKELSEILGKVKSPILSR